jgi:hypothetical protein
MLFSIAYTCFPGVHHGGFMKLFQSVMAFFLISIVFYGTPSAHAKPPQGGGKGAPGAGQRGPAGPGGGPGMDMQGRPGDTPGGPLSLVGESGMQPGERGEQRLMGQRGPGAAPAQPSGPGLMRDQRRAEGGQDREFAPGRRSGQPVDENPDNQESAGASQMMGPRNPEITAEGRLRKRWPSEGPAGGEAVQAAMDKEAEARGLDRTKPYFPPPSKYTEAPTGEQGFSFPPPQNLNPEINAGGQPNFLPPPPDYRGQNREGNPNSGNSAEARDNYGQKRREEKGNKRVLVS